MISDLNMSHGKCLILFHFLLLEFPLVITLRNFDFKSHWNTLIFFDKKINGIRFEYVPWKNVWLCSISLFGFKIVIKLRNFDFESHWNTLIFFDKNIYDIRFEYIPWKNIWFCFICIVWVYFIHKTENRQFWKSLKYFKFFL